MQLVYKSAFQHQAFRLFHFGKGHALAVVVILTHVSLISAFNSISSTHVVLALGVYFLTGCIGSSAVLHRLLSHRSWSCPRWLEIVGTFFITIGLIGSSITWASIHRAHHMYTDTPLDPHSPHHQHWLRVHFFTMIYKPRLRLAKDLIKDPVHRFFHRYYWFVNLTYVFVLLFIWGFDAVIWAYAVPAVFLWHAGSGINSIGHLWGSQSYTHKDHSKNNLLLSLLMWGEGWHNNHHRFPKRPIFQIKWYEVDLGGFVVKIFNTKQAVKTIAYIGGGDEKSLLDISSRH